MLYKSNFLSRFFFNSGFAMAGFILASSISVSAQQRTDLPPEEFSVVKDYNPLLAEAKKLAFQADFPPPEPVKKTLDYESPGKLLTVAYEPAPLKPLALPAEKKEPTKDSWARAGFGSQWTPFAEARLNLGKYEKSWYGLFGKHHSSRGKLKHQDFSENRVGAFAGANVGSFTIQTEAFFNRRGVFYYGYHNLFSDTIFDRKEVKQRFSEIDWMAEMRNNKENKLGIDNYTRLHINRMGDFYDTREFVFEAFNGTKKVFKNNHFVGLNLHFDYTGTKDTTQTLNRKIFSFNPSYTFDNGSWFLSAGLTGTQNGPIFYLFPDFATGKNLLEDKIIFYNGWSRQLHKNSFSGFVQQNPWVGSIQHYVNSRVEDRYLGFKGNIANRLTYNAKFSQKIWNNMPLFVNDSLDMRRFQVVYDKRTTAINLLLDLNYRPMENLTLGFIGNYYRYEPDVEIRAWHLPSLIANLYGHYRLNKNVLLGVEFFGIDRVNALVKDEIVRLNGTADFSLFGGYSFSDRLSFWARANNLAHIKYQRYYLYPGYGINFLAGASLTF